MVCVNYRKSISLASSGMISDVWVCAYVNKSFGLPNFQTSPWSLARLETVWDWCPFSFAPGNIYDYMDAQLITLLNFQLSVLSRATGSSIYIPKVRFHIDLVRHLDFCYSKLALDWNAKQETQIQFTETLNKHINFSVFLFKHEQVLTPKIAIKWQLWHKSRHKKTHS